MARGWESKSVESQQADREAASGRMPALDEAQASRVAHRQTLQLARQRALADLQAACRPAHRAMLEATIAELDRQLRQVGLD
jgi:hypothetical protein